jgi:hypothetical protein
MSAALMLNVEKILNEFVRRNNGVFRVWQFHNPFRYWG